MKNSPKFSLRQFITVTSDWLTLQFRRDSESQNHENRSTKNWNLNYWDICLVLLFLIFACFYFVSRLQYGYPLTRIGGDAANIASFAAAYDNPKNFQDDGLLSNLDNIRIYYTIHIPLLRWLNTLVGNYGLGFQLLLIPTVFIQMLSFYLFGRVWLRSRYWALLWMVLNLAAIQMIYISEGWGIFEEPVPRFTFQALLPFVLVLVWIWRDAPWRWVIVMAFTGLLVYVHPVSTPAWFAAILLGFWYLMPTKWSFFKRLIVLAGLGISGLFVMLPFIITYLSHHIHGVVQNYELLMKVLTNYFPSYLLNPPRAILQILIDMTSNGLLPLAILGFLIVWFRRGYERRKLYLAIYWMLGLLLVSLIIPSIERIIERMFSLAPFETELIRGMRYFIFFMELFIIWGLSELSQIFRKGWASKLVMASGLLLVLFYLPKAYDVAIARTLDCFQVGKLICEQAVNKDNEHLITAIQERTAPGASFFYSFDATDTRTLEIRYLAKRSLVYSYKDKGLLAYSNPEQLKNWYQIFEEVNSHKNIIYWAKNNPQNFMDFLKKYQVDYLILPGNYPENFFANLETEIVFRNGSYLLLAVPPTISQP